MVRALRDTIILGVTTNIPYLLAILQEPSFLAGQTTTNYLAEHFPTWQPPTNISESDWLALAALEATAGGVRQKRSATDDAAAQPDPWHGAAAWRNVIRD
jgi:acetyl/propionyl-CoA carboxylase alpha subunit